MRAHVEWISGQVRVTATGTYGEPFLWAVHIRYLDYPEVVEAMAAQTGGTPEMWHAVADALKPLGVKTIRWFTWETNTDGVRYKDWHSIRVR